MNDKIRIGIIGCSTIAKSSTIPAILKSNNSKLEFIGSRSEEKAKKFASEFGCKKYGSYDDILGDDDVDAVYISTPIGTHEEWVLKAAQAGKHVLCEKSSTISFRSAKRMVSVCKENNVRLMEGFMYRFHPSHQKVKEFINKGTLGKLFSFSSRYGFPPIPKNNIRYDKSLGGGILNDAGCYPINASRMLFESEPECVLCDLVIDKEKKVDTKAAIFMKFNQDRYSQSVVGYDLFYQSVYNLWGSEGSLNLTRAYNVPSNMHVTLDITAGNVQDRISIEPSDHFQLMISVFCNELQNPHSSDYNFEDDILCQARVMEAARISNNEKRYVEIEDVT
ncbi:MAG: Gfo/Idh/MocA family oxidoreductase [Thermoproteota archaeon]